MLFHLYIILMSIILIIELTSALLSSLWLSKFIDIQAKVFFFVSCIPCILAILMMMLGTPTISFALAIVSVVIVAYAFYHPMTNMDATLAPKPKGQH